MVILRANQTMINLDKVRKVDIWGNDVDGYNVVAFYAHGEEESDLIKWCRERKEAENITREIAEAIESDHKVYCISDD